MIKYKWKEYREAVPVSTVCDVCGKELEVPFNSTNAIHIEKDFGYGSSLDGMHLEIDICEDCFIERIGKLLVGNCMRSEEYA